MFPLSFCMLEKGCGEKAVPKRFQVCRGVHRLKRFGHHCPICCTVVSDNGAFKGKDGTKKFNSNESYYN